MIEVVICCVFVLVISIHKNKYVVELCLRNYDVDSLVITYERPL